MNGTEQKTHRTAIADLRGEMVKGFKSLEDDFLKFISLSNDAHNRGRDEQETRFGILMGTMKDEIERPILLRLEYMTSRFNAEYTWTLEQNRQQRNYVDAQDSAIWKVLKRGFWGRLNWLLRGK